MPLCVAVKAISIASRVRLAPLGTQRAFGIELGGHGLHLRAEVVANDWVDGPNGCISVTLPAQDLLAFAQSRACLAEFDARLTHVEARLLETGVMRLYQHYALGPGFPDMTTPQFSVFNARLIEVTTPETPIYRAIFAALQAGGMVVDLGHFRLDQPPLYPPEQAVIAYDQSIGWDSWHGAHYWYDHAEAPLQKGEGQLVRGAVRGLISASVVSFAFQRLSLHGGRFAWAVAADLPSPKVMADMIDVATLAMDKRLILDRGRSNAATISGSIGRYLSMGKGNRLSDLLKYVVEHRNRLSMADRHALAVDPVFRVIGQDLTGYYAVAEQSVESEKDFANLQLAISASVQDASERFSRVVSIVALLFTALSFVTTGIAVADFVNKSEALPWTYEQSRFLVLILSLLPGVLGLMLALYFSRRRQLP